MTFIGSFIATASAMAMILLVHGIFDIFDGEGVGVLLFFVAIFGFIILLVGNLILYITIVKRLKDREQAISGSEITSQASPSQPVEPPAQESQSSPNENQNQTNQ
ncbi:MAG: hypothetical protein CEN90_438 [Parcubacteria group bacterium Licking1014_17]|nr:MAG: hypothetical protein CEN90_438 [Parcubacteria group bacterium Licking1014_17]